MKDKIIRFMRGRYGNDQLSGFLIWTGLIVMVLDAIIKTGILYGLGLVMVIYGYVRVFSKKYSLRRAQNKWFLEKTAGVRLYFKKLKKSKEAGKEYRIFICNTSAHLLRVRNGGGKIEIRCPKCGNKFIKKS